MTATYLGDNVLVATQDNFDSLIPGKELDLVRFFGPWSGNCRKVAGEYYDVATVLEGKAKLVDVHERDYPSCLSLPPDVPHEHGHRKENVFESLKENPTRQGSIGTVPSPVDHEAGE